LLHTWDGGKNWNTGGFHKWHLSQLHGLLTDPALQLRSVLETGAGNSTLTFLFAQPDRLVSVLPAAATDLMQRIRDFALSAALPCERWTCELEQSEFALPRLCREAGNSSPFDFILIDGSHGLPSVFVDLYFANRLLRNGGLLVLDDVNLHSVKEAARLLREQPQFMLKLDLGKALVFQKVAEFKDFGDWGGQPYVRRKTAEYATQARPEAL
jgi:precorrin-6B methylase 2